MSRPKVTIAPKATALTIAGSDPSGGAGLQADLKAFQQNGVYGMSAVTLLTVQNTVGITRVDVMPVDLVLQQIDAVLDDIPPRAVKTGALGNAENIAAVADRLADYDVPLVVDPVMVSKHGDPLADDASVEAYRQSLFPIASLITPNRFEAERLLGRSLQDADRDALFDAAFELASLGSRYVLLKAGRLGDQRCHVFVDGEQCQAFEVPDHDSKQTHGAGCALSATLTARLALTTPKDGDTTAQFEAAVLFGIRAVNQAVAHAPGLGGGCGPVESRILHIGD